MMPNVVATIIASAATAAIGWGLSGSTRAAAAVGGVVALVMTVIFVVEWDIDPDTGPDGSDG